jgi:UPF0716 family protein affecting phage T7 exclusion
MYKMDLAEGSLVLSGFLLIICGVVNKIANFNFLTPFIKTSSAAFISANTCFLIAVIVYLFGKEE